VLEPSGLYYPNRFAYYFFVAMHDVLGVSALKDILELAGLMTFLNGGPPDNLERQFDFAYMAAINHALQTVYGARGGRGVALRIGRSWFDSGMHHFGALAAMNSAPVLALPLERRTYLGLSTLAALFNHYSDQQTRLTVRDGAYHFQVANSPLAWQQRSDKPVCHALAGLVQGTLHWSSGGYEYHVHEQSCRAAGAAACVFVANQKPIGQR